jgi:hypothetical protein
MLVSELFSRLSYGELSNLSMSNEGAGTIVDAKQPKVIGYLNEALLRLHGRFMLKMNDVLITPLADETFYKLDSTFSVLGAEEFPYIVDTLVKPFTNDVIRVLEVYDVNGVRIPLNDVENLYSVFTPQPTVLQIPYPIEDAPISVLYQAWHPAVTNSPTTVIDIPLTLEKALTAYIAHLVFSHMNGQENAMKAKEHLNTYESVCVEVEAKDLVSTSSSSTNTKFDQRGFV